MAKKTPQELLDETKQARNEAERLKRSVTQFNKTAETKSKVIDTLAKKGKQTVDTLASDLKLRFSNESSLLKKAAKTETDVIETLRKDAKTHYNQFNKTYSAATHKQTGVEARHTTIVKLTEDAGTKTNDISKNATKASNSLDKIKEFQGTSKKQSTLIGTIYEEASAIKQEIEDTYAITLDTTMAGTFKERRDDLKGRTRLWEICYLISIALIGVGIFVALLWDKPTSFIDVLSDRLVFVTPLVLVSFVFSRQFNHERKLYEEYAFKTAAAQALRGYTLLLNEQFKDDKAPAEILKFTIGSMADIFDRDPLNRDMSNYHFIFGGGWAKLEAKIDEKVHKAATEAAENVIEKVRPS